MILHIIEKYKFFKNENISFLKMIKNFPKMIILFYNNRVHLHPVLNHYHIMLNFLISKIKFLVIFQKVL